jgi:hypothetical protein
MSLGSLVSLQAGSEQDGIVTCADLGGVYCGVHCVWLEARGVYGCIA